ncbi:MAG: GNAT family N-acetyltransferase [Rhodobacterales bacterium]|nr:GNAT family N-acetyltransferase [Rhodobacterales bacterium]
MTPAEMAAIHAAAMSTPRPWSGGEFAALLALPGTFATDIVPHAFALGRVTLDEAELLTLATHPDHRRLGLARAHLAAFHHRAAACGAARAFLEVAADNAPARALYDAAGYTTAGTRRGYYTGANGAAVDALVMVRWLGAG